MKKQIWVSIASFVAVLPLHGQTSQRPKIFGFYFAQVQATDHGKSAEFYSKLLGRPTVNIVFDSGNQAKKFEDTAFPTRRDQHLDVGSGATPSPYKMVNDFGFFTDDAPALLKYLQSQGIEAQGTGKSAVTGVVVQDQEGHRLTFLQHKPDYRKEGEPTAPGAQMGLIHVGFIVWNREKIDHFYKDILGFRLYWQGGMKDGQTDWVCMQVPDGTDWIEYMLNVPENADKHLLGVMNHIALGVADVHAAAKELEAKGMRLPEQPKIGRDGKWQLNLYDPDGTRVELMEFTPVEKPCCAEFTGPHPKP